MNPRALATDIVATWLKSNAFPDRLLEGLSDHRAWVMEVVLGVVRRRRSLDWICNILVRHEPDNRLRPILLVGLYQLLFMKTAEAYAVVNETVEMTRGQPCLGTTDGFRERRAPQRRPAKTSAPAKARATAGRHSFLPSGQPAGSMDARPGPRRRPPALPLEQQESADHPGALPFPRLARRIPCTPERRRHPRRPAPVCTRALSRPAAWCAPAGPAGL